MAKSDLQELDLLLEQLCEDLLEEDAGRRLVELLDESEVCRRRYLDTLELHAALWRAGGAGVRMSQMPPAIGIGQPQADGQSDVDAQNAEVPRPELPSPCPEPLIPPIILDQPSAGRYPLSTGHSFIGSPVFSYTVATMIVGMMLLGAWAYKITHYQQSANKRSPSNTQPGIQFVGQITGLVDCRWSDPSTETYLRASVPLGRKYALASGLMEIAYKSGAKVILEGPCTYEVESSAGGFLALGKLTARIEKRGEGRGVRGEGAANPKSPNLQISKSPNLQIPSSFIPHPSSFVVRTPTAIVIDLGTEFGVEVGENGDTTSQVFRGSVKVQVVGDDGLPPPSGKGTGGKGRAIQLSAGESARVEKGKKTGHLRIVTGGEAGTPPKFVRRMVEPPKLLDLLDIVAGGNGLGRCRETGIDPSTGIKDQQFVAWTRRGDGQYHPVKWSRFVDGVFVPDGRAGAVRIDSAGGAFDGFPHASGITFGSIWARSAKVARPEMADEVPQWVYSMGNGEQFMPNGRGLLALHANAGITFDLDAVRRINRDARPARFQARAGMADVSRLLPTAVGTADVWVLIDGQVKFKRAHLLARDGTFEVNVGLGPGDRFLTLATTDTGAGHAYTLVVFGDPVLQMESTESEKK